MTDLPVWFEGAARALSFLGQTLAAPSTRRATAVMARSSTRLAACPRFAGMAAEDDEIINQSKVVGIVYDPPQEGFPIPAMIEQLR